MSTGCFCPLGPGNQPGNISVDDSAAMDSEGCKYWSAPAFEGMATAHKNSSPAKLLELSDPHWTLQRPLQVCQTMCCYDRLAQDQGRHLHGQCMSPLGQRRQCFAQGLWLGCSSLQKVVLQQLSWQRPLSWVLYTMHGSSVCATQGAIPRQAASAPRLAVQLPWVAESSLICWLIEGLSFHMVIINVLLKHLVTM